MDGDPFIPVTSMMMPVGDGHQIYVETVGAAHASPAVYLHGGPGSGCQPSHRGLFDPSRQYAVLFDQRGAGRSTPARLRSSNTTSHLIADMEAIRIALGIEQWLVVGGSWGATLALAYAQAHPTRVSGLVLRATFLGTRAELDWAFGEAPKRFYPGLYADFLSVLNTEEQARPIDAYWRRILHPDPAVHGPAARAWHDLERVLSTATPSVTRLDIDAIYAALGPLPASAFMEAHYFSNDCFLKPNQLSAEAGKLAEIPGIIIQGQNDLLCPPSTSRALSKVWTNSEVRVIADAGHAQSEPGVTLAMINAISELARFG